MIEEWRPIEGYEGLYEVSSYGRVRSLDRYVKGKGYRLHKGKVLIPVKSKLGYLQLNLYYNGKRHQSKIHRLVAQAFLPNPDNLPMINHKDEDKTNNNVDNLEWCSAKYNVNYGTSRIRAKETAIKNGSYTGLSRDEYLKKYYQDHKDKICERQKKYDQENKDRIKDRKRTYYLKRKEQIQNNA